MTMSSMTGFARVEGTFSIGPEPLRWFWEVRSVNARGLDIRFRLAPGFEGLEPAARVMIGERFKRGSIVTLLNPGSTQTSPRLRLNRETLSRVLQALNEIRAETGSPPPTAEGVLAIRGVLETEDVPPSEDMLLQRDTALLTSLSNALDRLAQARQEEGRRLGHILAGHIDRIETLTEAARQAAQRAPERAAEKLRRQVGELLDAGANLAPERLAQELALIAVRQDVREEIDRLLSHVAQARSLIASNEPQGRRLDFLAQEFNREANTLCSKSSELDLTRVGLELKAVIDQLREQIQNVE